MNNFPTRAIIWLFNSTSTPDHYFEPDNITNYTQYTSHLSQSPPPGVDYNSNSSIITAALLCLIGAVVIIGCVIALRYQMQNSNISIQEDVLEPVSEFLHEELNQEFTQEGPIQI